jgi:gamma-glutamyltranspeptidase / glutathione hydrolase
LYLRLLSDRIRSALFMHNIQKFNSRRSTVFARNGMVATAHPLASSTALLILREGGNAIDAAVAAASVLAVTQPHQTGLGGDLFAIVFERKSNRAFALNASGTAPAAIRLEDFQAAGRSSIPQHSPLAWTVPGCVDGWCLLLERFGTMPMAKVLEPAIGYAENGFPVAPVDAEYWVRHEEVLRSDEGCRACLLLEDRLPAPGEVLVQPTLASTLRLVAEGGRDAFYRGPVASAIDRFSRRAGGVLAAADLAGFSAEWQDPLAYGYKGHTVLQCPPNGQGLAALLALRNVRDAEFSAVPRDAAECIHWLVEATKSAMTEAAAVVCDPLYLRSDPLELLAGEPPAIAAGAQVPESRPPSPSDTVFLAVADSHGNAISFISSVYGDFGSGYCIPDLGFILQNRGSGFSLDPDHPNCVAPGKRPYHTIIPGMTLKDGSPSLVFGVTGGFLQPQGHLQLLVNLLDYGMDIQSAVDFPRFWWEGGLRVVLEDGFTEDVYEELARRGHEVVRRPGHFGFGGAQIIQFLDSSDVIAGASEPRQDGLAIGW